MKEVTEHVLRCGYDHLIYVAPTLEERNTDAQAQGRQAFCTLCHEAVISFCITGLADAEASIVCGRKNAFVCPTDLYAIKLRRLAKKHQAGIIGFDNIRLIDVLSLQLASASYDVPLTARIAVDHILDGAPIPHTVPHKLITRDSV